MNRPARVLHLTHSLRFGGAEKLLVSLTSKIDREKFQQMVGAITYTGPVEEELKEKGVLVKHFDKKNGIDLSIFPKLINFMRQEKIDIVHTHLPTADSWGRIAAKLAGVPIVVSTYHGPLVGDGFWDLLREKFLSIFVDAFVAISGATQDSLKHRLGFKREILLAYNGINISRFQERRSRSLKREELGIPHNALVIGNVGRLDKMKGQCYFLEALQMVISERENAFGIIVGEGHLEESLKALADKLKVANKCLFLKNREDIPELLQAMDIFAMSSCSEGLPLVLLEAMASRLPIVTTGVGGIGEVITDGVNGIIIAPRNPARLAEGILRIAKNKDLGYAFSERGFALVRDKFNEDKMASLIESLYERLINEKRL
jgi:glycosyltransferase involved in cell wall biosynthesis